MTDHQAEDGTDQAEDEAQEAAPADDAGDAPADGKDRLQALEEDIEEVRRRVGEPLDQGDTSIEKGAADQDQPIDDTIAPPG